jgi:alpha,alpha-trehalose-phosphate synthase [UDP-forming]
MSPESAWWRRSKARKDGPDLVIVANRLPVEFDAEEGWRRAPGGLVSAMESVLRDTEAVWVGWSGQFSDEETAPGRAPAPRPPDKVGGIELVTVPLTQAEVAAHYDGFSNGALWPNYHGGIVAPVYHRSQFEAHRAVNQRFADLVADTAPLGARVWVHDYQLQLVPAMLRARRPDLRIGFFLHIPFPPVETFSQLPWRAQIIEGLLGADVVGFQTSDAVINFQRAARRFGPVINDDGALHIAEEKGTRPVVVRAFPIGIRAGDYATLAAQPEVRQRAKQIRADVGDPDVLLLGVDRLDYTKGIDVRIQAVTELMLDGDLDPERTAFIQVAPPTRAKVEEYQKIRDEVELLVSRANGALGPVGTNPIHYMHQAVGPDELAALYVAADVMLVTPLRDGMNLVAKEYVAARIHGRGSLVLSEFTGAAEQMSEAWLVNPYDITGMKHTIMAALQEPAEQAVSRMRALRAGVIHDDVSKWAQDFLAALPPVVADVP